MAQSAVGAIRAGCQMLSEGKAFIDDAKSEIEGVVGQFNEAKEQALGLWETIMGLKDWALGLLGSVTSRDGSPSTKQVNDINVADTTKSVTEAPKPAAKKAKRKQAEVSYEEFQARTVHDICENLKVYFEAMRQLKAHCRELEQEALTTERVADSAIDRIEMEWQMNQLSAQLKQSMIYGTPESLGLGALYQEFLIKHGEILEEQEVARALKAKKERDNAWRHEHRNQILIAKLTYVVAVVVGLLELTGLYFTL
jgi:hypothetical protein